jgi:hypothetical protein
MIWECSRCNLAVSSIFNSGMYINEQSFSRATSASIYNYQLYRQIPTISRPYHRRFRPEFSNDPRSYGLQAEGHMLRPSVHPTQPDCRPTLQAPSNGWGPEWLEGPYETWYR